MKKYIVLAGNIGAGKSTLVGLLSARLGFTPYYEPVAENPFLHDFYTDMRRWAFNSQVFFLTHRVRSHRALMEDPHSVVQDRSLYEDAEVFARNLHERGDMSDRDWDGYSELYRTLCDLLPAPDLVVYLRAALPTLRARIAKRGREFEAGISDESSIRSTRSTSPGSSPSPSLPCSSFRATASTSSPNRATSRPLRPASRIGSGTDRECFFPSACSGSRPKGPLVISCRLRGAVWPATFRKSLSRFQFRRIARSGRRLRGRGLPGGHGNRGSRYRGRAGAPPAGRMGKPRCGRQPACGAGPPRAPLGCLRRQDDGSPHSHRRAKRGRPLRRLRELRGVLRPGRGDPGWAAKYGHRDHRGGGRFPAAKPWLGWPPARSPRSSWPLRE